MEDRDNKSKVVIWIDIQWISNDMIYIYL